MSRCACASCRCQPLNQPMQECSQAARGHPVSIPLECGAPNRTVLTVNQPLRSVCLLALPSPCSSRWRDIAQLGLCLTQCVHPWGRVWSIPPRTAEIYPLRPNMKPELPTAFSAVSVAQVHLPVLHKNLGEILSSLPRFLLELWHLL